MKIGSDGAFVFALNLSMQNIMEQRLGGWEAHTQ